MAYAFCSVLAGWCSCCVSSEGCFAQLVPVVVSRLGDTFPEMRRNEEKVMHTIHREEQQFSRTLDKVSFRRVLAGPKNFLRGSESEPVLGQAGPVHVPAPSRNA